MKIGQHVGRHAVDDVEEDGEVVRAFAQDRLTTRLIDAGLDLSGMDPGGA